MPLREVAAVGVALVVPKVGIDDRRTRYSRRDMGDDAGFYMHSSDPVGREGQYGQPAANESW
jgi:hypothetical protein